MFPNLRNIAAQCFLLGFALLGIAALLAAQNVPDERKEWHASWIAHPTAPLREPGVYHFRKTFHLDAKPDRFVVLVSADNRFQLYVNGQRVGEGPARGDLPHWRYETLDLAPFLRAGDKGVSRPLHVFNCAPSPTIFAISVEVDPGSAVWTAYGAEAMRVEVRPDFGWLNVIVAAFVPKLHAWFDPNDGWAFVGDEAARYYKGPRIMLVKTRGSDSPGATRRTK